MLSRFVVAPALLLAGAVAVAAEPVKWLAVTEIAAGRGERGPWRQNDSRFDFVDDPTVAIDARGDLLVAWVEQARKDVLLQRLAPDGTRRGAPVNVSVSPTTFSWLPRIAVAADAPNRVFVAWQEIVFSGGSHGGEMLFARSDDGGATFGAPLNLSNSIAGDGKGRIHREVWHNGSLDVVAARDGAVIVAWTEYEGPLWVARSSDGGRTFARPLQVSGGRGTNPARGPALAPGEHGTVYLAWTVGDDDAADIHLARSTDGGASFGAARVIARTAGYSDAPKLAVDARGTLHVAFGESMGGPFERSHIRYGRSSDGGRTFEPMRDLSNAAERWTAFPALAVDVHGHVVVLWELIERGRPRGLGFALSRDGGASFAAPAAIAASADPSGAPNGSSQGLLMRKLALRDGRLAVVNSSLALDEASRVWLLRGAISR